jgi:hypothetical protein
MGWTPAEVRRCTVWEFWAAWEGWLSANTTESAAAPLTRSELDEIVKTYDPNAPARPRAERSKTRKIGT